MSRSIFICLDDVSFYGGNSSFPVFDSDRSNPITTKEAVIILKSDIKSSSIVTKRLFISRTMYHSLSMQKSSRTGKILEQTMISGFIGSETKTLYFDECNDELVSSSYSFHSLMAKRFIYNHKVYHDFHKIIICIWNQDLNEPLSNFYVQYCFDNGEHMLTFSCLIVAEIRKSHNKQSFPSETTSRHCFIKE